MVEVLAATPVSAARPVLSRYNKGTAISPMPILRRYKPGMGSSQGHGRGALNLMA